MAFDILELPSIPRERDKLKAIMGEARYKAKKSRFIRLLSYVIIAIGVVILSLGSCAAPSTPHEAAYLTYLPLSQR
jgi:heme/copper-type cytochrome/quinol oxidase subunit 1